MLFDFSHFEVERRAVVPTPIRKRRSMDFAGSITVRGQIPAPAAPRTAEHSPRKRIRVDVNQKHKRPSPIPFRLDSTNEVPTKASNCSSAIFQMPPACCLVGDKFIFPSQQEVGDKASNCSSAIFQMPPACCLVGDKLIFPSHQEVGDIVMGAPKLRVPGVRRVRRRGDRRGKSKSQRSK